MATLTSSLPADIVRFFTSALTEDAFNIVRRHLVTVYDIDETHLIKKMAVSAIFNEYNNSKFNFPKYQYPMYQVFRNPFMRLYYYQDCIVTQLIAEIYPLLPRITADPIFIDY